MAHFIVKFAQYEHLFCVEFDSLVNFPACLVNLLFRESRYFSTHSRGRNPQRRGEAPKSIGQGRGWGPLFKGKWENVFQCSKKLPALLYMKSRNLEVSAKNLMRYIDIPTDFQAGD